MRFCFKNSDRNLSSVLIESYYKFIVIKLHYKKKLLLVFSLHTDNHINKLETQSPIIVYNTEETPPCLQHQNKGIIDKQQ